MTDQPDTELPDDIVALLGDDAVWTDLEPAVIDSTVAAVMAEIERDAATASERPIAPVIDLAARRTERWQGAVMGAAAALLLVVGGLVVASAVTGDDPAGSDVELALAGTDLEPDASGSVGLTATPNGTRIRISTADLPPAPEGFYYEAWLRTGPEVGVSAGTFHLRSGGDVEIELWAGVLIDDYPLFTVTLQPEGMAESSGQVVLAGRFER